jgi:hypothetical protein
MSGGFPKNFQELQRAVQRAQRGGGPFPSGGGPGGAAIGLLVFGLGGAYLFSNSIYNGT